MNLKRVLALAMSAGMLVSAPLTVAGTTTSTIETDNFMSEEEKAHLERMAEERAFEERKAQEEAFEKAQEAVREEAMKAAETAVENSVTIEEVDDDLLDVDLLKDSAVQNPVQELLDEETVSAEDLVRVIIVMDGDSIIESDSEAVMNSTNKVKTRVMEQKQDAVVSTIEEKALDGEELDISYHYTWLLNGVATEVPFGMIDKIEAIKGVEDVILQPVYNVCETKEISAVADEVMIGRDAAWAEGYTGKGIKIAMIDTGIDEDHQNFGALEEEKLTADSATQDTISSVLGQLNASALYSGLTVDDVYYSTKIAYGFNYVDGNLVINHGSDTQGDHGTHVAGIAAANDLGNGEAVGVAPDAQLYVMKVFGADGGAYTEDVLAAVEDALILGADVINLSLGSPAGFTSGGEALDAIYGRVSETNTILAVSAGNAATMGEGNLWGTNTNLTSNPDNSTISSPATYVNATSVASVENDTAYKMSKFSSWGVSPDLSLEPDITAPGGNIYSTQDNGTYGLMSGTSMASPNLAGVSALVMQYAKEKYPEMTASELHTFVNALIMSTAIPLAYDETLDYSPRNQGAGLVNAYNAVKTGAYLSVNGEDVPKIELGDDPEKTGTYAYAFNVTNFSKTAVYYTMDTTSQTEGVVYDEYTQKNFMSMTPVALAATIAETSKNMVYTNDYNENGVMDTADARQLYLKASDANALASATDTFRFDVNKDDAVNTADVQAYLDTLVGKQAENVCLTEEVLKVAAGETAVIHVTVNVEAEGKNYMDTNFENGIYVEGFTTLTAKNTDGVDLSLPYMGFYGDWTKAPILDSGYYWQEEVEANQYYNILFTSIGSKKWTPGNNPYLNGEAFDMSHISLSPNGDGNMDYLNDMYVSLLRNARTLSFTYTDVQTGEVYFEKTVGNVTKSYFSSANGLCTPFVYSWYNSPYMLTDKEGNTLQNNTKLNLSIKATLDYDKHASNNLSDEWVIPITIDTEKPVLTTAQKYVDESAAKEYLELTFSDNVATAAVMFLDATGSRIAGYGTDKVAAGESCTMLFDITGFGDSFYVLLGDYAGNESVFAL